MDIDIDSLVPLPLSTSIVWKYFGFLSIRGEIDDRNYVYCKRCKMRIKYSNNTSNLYKHFATHHSSDYEQLYAMRKIRTGPEVHEPTAAKRFRSSNPSGDNNINASLLGNCQIKLDMVDPEPIYIDSCSSSEPLKNVSKPEVTPIQTSNPNRFITSSPYIPVNAAHNFPKKSSYVNSVNLPTREAPSAVVNNGNLSNSYSYQIPNISETGSFLNCPVTHKSVKCSENPHKPSQWGAYCQNNNNNNNNNSPNSGVILDVLGALATVRRYCEANGLELGLLQQLEKQIAVSELHRLSQ